MIGWLKRVLGAAMAGASVVQPQASTPSTPSAPASVVQAGKSERDIAQAQARDSENMKRMVEHARQSIRANLDARKIPPRDWKSWKEPAGDGQSWCLEVRPPTDDEWDDALRGTF